MNEHSAEIKTALIYMSNVTERMQDVFVFGRVASLLGDVSMADFEIFGKRQDEVSQDFFELRGKLNALASPADIEPKINLAVGLLESERTRQNLHNLKRELEAAEANLTNLGYMEAEARRRYKLVPGMRLDRTRQLTKTVAEEKVRILKTQLKGK